MVHTLGSRVSNRVVGARVPPLVWVCSVGSALTLLVHVHYRLACREGSSSPRSMCLSLWCCHCSPGGLVFAPPPSCVALVCVALAPCACTTVLSRSLVDSSCLSDRVWAAAYARGASLVRDTRGRVIFISCKWKAVRRRDGHRHACSPASLPLGW